MTDTLVGRLRADAVQLRKMIKAASFAGDGTSVRVLDPSGLLADLDEAAAEIERLTRELAEAQRASEYANDCFNEASAKLAAAESSLSEAVKALEPFAKAYEEPHCEALGLVTITVKQKDLRRASAIRSRAAVLE